MNVFVPMIVFFFLGDSRMNGYCSTMDNELDKNVYSWNPKNGFYLAADSNNKNFFITRSGSMVQPFLKGLATRYPSYNFCGIEYGHPCGQAHHILEEKRHMDFIDSRISAMMARKDSGVIIGGIVLCYGFVEGGNIAEIHNFHRNMLALVNYFREKTDNSTLPVIFHRWEKNSSNTGGDHVYHENDSIMIDADESLATIGFSFHTPVRYLNRDCYCNNDHHQNRKGDIQIANDAVTLFQLYNFDFWSRN